MVNKTIVESVKDAIAAASTVVESAKSELLWLLPPELLAFAGRYGLTARSRMLIENGVHVRGITQISEAQVEMVRGFLDIGEEVRHIDQYRGEFMVVADKRESVSSIPQQAVTVGGLSLDDRIIGFWTDDPAYAEYLVESFEASWKEAVDARRRIQELEQGRPRA
jgi:hypothetical protein